MSDGEAKLKKLRTFYDDATRAQTASATEAFPSDPKADPLMKARLKEAKTAELPEETIIESQAAEPEVVKQAPVPKPPIAPVSVMPVSAPAVSINTTKLKSHIDVSALRKNAGDSLLSGHGAIFSTIEEGNETSVGHIITDQKRDRFKLLPAVGQAMRDWFQKHQQTVTKMIETKETGPVISDVTTRQEILKDAAQRSALAPKDDYTKVARRIKKIAKINQAPTTLVIKKAAEVAAPSWTYLEGDETETKNPEPEATLGEQKETEPPKDMILPPPELGIETTAASVIAAKLPEPEAPIVPVLESAMSEPKPEAKTADPSWFTAAVETGSAAPALADTREKTAAPRLVYQKAAPEFFPLWRIGAVAVLAILLGTSLTLWLFDNEETVVVQENQFTPLLKADELISIELGQNRQDLLGSIRNLDPRPTSIAVIAYPTVNISGATEQAAVSDIMNTLAWKAPGSFVRGVTDINFGLYRNSDPFIVLKVTSFDTAFGGILEWENMMSADLAPLFGQPVLGTFDPLARTATQIRDPYFTDVVVDNIDSRILTDETEKERIIYAFANRNTIIITSSKSTLGDLLNLFR